MSKYISSENLKAILVDLLAKVQSNTNAAIASVHQLDIKIVATKPIENISTSTLYLVEKPVGEQTAENKYDEYMYVNGAWELYGEVTIDLSAYAKTVDVTAAINAALVSYAKTADMTAAIAAAIADKVTAVQVDTQISTALQSLTTEEVTTLKTELGIV